MNLAGNFGRYRCRDRSARCESGLRSIGSDSVAFDRVKLTVSVPPRNLLQAACVRPQMRIVDDPAHLSFDAADLDRIRTGRGREQSPPSAQFWKI